MGLVLFWFAGFCFLVSCFFISYQDFVKRSFSAVVLIFWTVVFSLVALVFFPGFPFIPYLLVFPLFAFTNIAFGDSLMFYTTGVFTYIGNTLYHTGYNGYMYLSVTLGLCYLGSLLLKPVFKLQKNKKGVPLIPLITINQVIFLYLITFHF